VTRYACGYACMNSRTSPPSHALLICAGNLLQATHLGCSMLQALTEVSVRMTVPMTEAQECWQCRAALPGNSCYQVERAVQDMLLFLACTCCCGLHPSVLHTSGDVSASIPRPGSTGSVGPPAPRQARAPLCSLCAATGMLRLCFPEGQRP